MNYTMTTYGEVDLLNVVVKENITCFKNKLDMGT